MRKKELSSNSLDCVAMRLMPVLLMLSTCLIFGCTNDGDSGPSSNACDMLKLRETPDLSSVKIINGTPCSENGSPIVEITLLADDGNIGICTGALITDRLILTAAHCYIEEYAGKIERSSARVEGVDIPISQVTVHPRAEIPQNDVAIVKLRQSVTTEPLPILLDRPIQVGDIVSIYGYGLDEQNNFGSLRSGQMIVTGVTSQDIIARFSEGGSNVCFGDSGGPAIIRSNEGVPGIVGITSFGNSANCGSDGFSAFSNVQGRSIVNFIMNEAPDVIIF